MRAILFRALLMVSDRSACILVPRQYTDAPSQRLFSLLQGRRGTSLPLAGTHLPLRRRSRRSRGCLLRTPQQSRRLDHQRCGGDCRGSDPGYEGPTFEECESPPPRDHPLGVASVRPSRGQWFDSKWYCCYHNPTKVWESLRRSKYGWQGVSKGTYAKPPRFPEGEWCPSGRVCLGAHWLRRGSGI